MGQYDCLYVNVTSAPKTDSRSYNRWSARRTRLKLPLLWSCLLFLIANEATAMETQEVGRLMEKLAANTSDSARAQVGAFL